MRDSAVYFPNRGAGASIPKEHLLWTAEFIMFGSRCSSPVLSTGDQMILCIFGSRSIVPTDSEIDYAISICMEKKGWPKPTSIMSGMAPGVDTAAVRYARRTGIPIQQMPANWLHQGRNAGFVRNGEMARQATHFICFWDGVSRGTAHMMRCVKVQNKPLHMIVQRHRVFSGKEKQYV